MFSGGVLPVDRKAPRAVQEDQLERTDKRSVYFRAMGGASPPERPPTRCALFVDEDSVRLSKQGDPQVLVLKRTKQGRDGSIAPVRGPLRSVEAHAARVVADGRRPVREDPDHPDLAGQRVERLVHVGVLRHRAALRIEGVVEARL
jgi:hypothetical protein